MAHFVFRQERGERSTLLHDAIRRGELRQGWSWDESLDLESRDNFINNYARIANCERDEAVKVYRKIKTILRIEPGDVIVVPNQPDDSQFLVLTCIRGYEFGDPLAGTNDFRHTVCIDTERIKQFNFDAAAVSGIIKHYMKGRAYSSPVKAIKKTALIEAIDACLTLPDDTAREPFKQKMNAIQESAYEAWVAMVREEVSPHELETLVCNLLRSKGCSIEHTHVYDREGGDIDIICTQEVLQETPFGEMPLSFSFNIQVKHKTHIDNDDAWGVKQLLQMKERNPSTHDEGAEPLHP